MGKQWSVEVNVDKCGVMHMRRGVNRTAENFYADSKRIEVVEKYTRVPRVCDY